MNRMTYPCISKKITSPSGRESGTALVMAMVILLILTIIGVTALNTTSLEAKMAGNIQDTNFAFEAAESGLASSNGATLDLFNPVYTPGPTAGATLGLGRASVSVVTTFKAFAPIKRTNNTNNMYGIGFSAANFDQVSTGQVAASNATVVIHQGTLQIVPGQNN